MLSLQDLQTWVKRALEIQTENNPNFPQHAIFRANMGGTIFLKPQTIPHMLESITIWKIIIL